MSRSIESKTKQPDSHHDDSLNRSKQRTSDDDETADQHEQKLVNEKRLVRSMQVRLSTAQYEGSENRQKEEGVFAEAIEGEESSEASKENVERCQNG